MRKLLRRARIGGGENALEEEREGEMGSQLGWGDPNSFVRNKDISLFLPFLELLQGNSNEWLKHSSGDG